jgi:rare lipoprotein A
MAPGHAENAIPALTAPPTADSVQPRFEPADDTDAALVADPTAADGEADQAWEPVGSGVASWYGARFAGHRTASGEAFDPDEYTAAHRTLPFGTKVRVTNADGESVIVRINDRGPFAAGRVIDLSEAAADDLGITRAGSGRVTLAVLDR